MEGGGMKEKTKTNIQSGRAAVKLNKQKSIEMRSSVSVSSGLEMICHQPYIEFEFISIRTEG